MPPISSAVPAVPSAAAGEAPAPGEMVMLGALGGTRGAGVGDIPTGLLDGAAATGGGVAGPGLQGALSDGPPTPPASPGVATKTTGSVGRATIEGGSVEGSVANARSVVAGMGAAFRRCFNKGLAENPRMSGSLMITVAIGPNGEVLSTSPTPKGNLSGAVISCVAARVSAAQFAPPVGGSAKVAIPVRFDNP